MSHRVGNQIDDPAVGHRGDGSASATLGALDHRVRRKAETAGVPPQRRVRGGRPAATRDR